MVLFLLGFVAALQQMKGSASSLQDFTSELSKIIVHAAVIGAVFGAVFGAVVGVMIGIFIKLCQAVCGIFK